MAIINGSFILSMGYKEYCSCMNYEKCESHQINSIICTSSYYPSSLWMSLCCIEVGRETDLRGRNGNGPMPRVPIFEIFFDYEFHIT